MESVELEIEFVRNLVKKKHQFLETNTLYRNMPIFADLLLKCFFQVQNEVSI